MTVQGEVETTYEADLQLDLAAVLRQALERSDGLTLSDDPGHLSLDATYFDTADLRLAAAGITLRRRTGGADAGWHLKIPDRENEKVEKHVPLSAARHRVPAPLRRLVRARTLGEGLRPVARIRTERTTYAITDLGGNAVAEVADDRVEGTRMGAGDEVEAVLIWREVEIELAADSSTTLADLDTAVTAHGLVPAEGAARSKVLRVLGHAVPSPPPAPAGKRATAGEVVLHHLAGQVEQLRTHDPLVRLDRPDSVHRMRVATRRLRSALKTFRPVLAAQQADSLRSELAWLAGHLGPARDAEVMRARLEQVADTDGTATGASTVARSHIRSVDRDYRERHRDLLRVLASERYEALLDDLVELATSPDLTSLAGQPCDEVLPRQVRRAYRALRRAVPREPADGEQHDVQLHEARKKAKRARYAAEALEPVYGSPAGSLAAALEQVQADLGEHQDSVVLRQRLRQWVPGSSPQAAFTLGRWSAAEEERGRQAEGRFARSWRAARKKKLRRWLG